MIPTTLSERTFEQMLLFLKDTHKDPQRVYTFFSMVDRRKRLHMEIMESMRENYPNVLKSSIPYRSIVERMGVERQPVPAFAPSSDSAAAYRQLWHEVQGILMKIHPAKPIAGKKE
jgi:cellulose biosynthesis protein BcsQ